MEFEELKTLGSLPSPSGVALEVMRLTQRADVSIEDIAKPVQADPALTGELLKIVNSAVYSQDKPVISVKEAVLRLGIKVLSRLVLTLSVLDANQTGRCLAFDYDHYWSKSLLKGLVIQAVVKECQQRIFSAEEAFTIGLLSDIGRLALAQVYPDEYNTCLESVTTSLLERERELFAIDHNQITIGMLQDWGLPKCCTDAIQLLSRVNINDCIGDSSVDRFASQLKLAGLLTDEFDQQTFSAETLSLAQQHQLSEEVLDRLRSELLLEWIELSKLLSIPIKTIPNVLIAKIDRVLQNHNPLLFSSLKVLLVEDDTFQLKLLTTYLQKQGHQVVGVDNGQQALQQLMIDQPQLIISDFKMQSMDGMELSRTIRSTAHYENIYLILITGDKDKDIMSEAFNIGVDDFITKPINHVELDARIRGAQRAIQFQTRLQQEHKQIQRTAFELAAANRKLEKMAITDQLTNLPNRRYLMGRLEQEWSVFQRQGSSMALLVLDLDYFKRVNDHFGHDVGDKVLVHFAKVFEQSLRVSDIACRMGGEEFVVIAPNTDLQSVGSLAQRILANVRQHQPVDLAIPWLVTVSIGIAVADLQKDTNQWSDTLKRADKAVYEAKAAGRNTFKIG
jgi:diguanylate cyclase (GGDEF)-like protein